MPTLGLLFKLNSMENSLSRMFKWITRELLVSLQYITSVLTLGFLQISLVLLVQYFVDVRKGWIIGIIGGDEWYSVRFLDFRTVFF